MADNTTMGSTTDVLRTVDISGVKTGVSKLDVAVVPTLELLGLAAPDTLIVASSGLATSGAAYVAGNQLGNEFTFPLGRNTVRGAVITDAALIDKANIIGAVDLFLFQQASAPAGDRAANAWADTNAATYLGKIAFPTPDASANNRFSFVSSPVVVKGNASVNVFGVLITRTGHTFFGAVSDLVVVLGFEPV